MTDAKYGKQRTRYQLRIEVNDDENETFFPIKEKQFGGNEVRLITPSNGRVSFEGNIRSAVSRSSLVRRKNVASVKLSGQLTRDQFVHVNEL